MKIKYLTIANVSLLQNLFNKLTTESFAERLAQANMANKNDIANFVKKTDFGEKLKTLNKKITSNKTKHLLVENELNINRLSKEVKTISAKQLTKDLTYGCQILNGT